MTNQRLKSFEIFFFSITPVCILLLVRPEIHVFTFHLKNTSLVPSSIKNNNSIFMPTLILRFKQSVFLNQPIN